MTDTTVTVKAARVRPSRSKAAIAERAAAQQLAVASNSDDRIFAAVAELAEPTTVVSAPGRSYNRAARARRKAERQNKKRGRRS